MRYWKLPQIESALQAGTPIATTAAYAGLAQPRGWEKIEAGMAASNGRHTEQVKIAHE